MTRAEEILERIAVAITTPAPHRIGASLNPNLAQKKQVAKHAKREYKAGRKVQRLQKRLAKAQARQTKLSGGYE